MIRNMSTSFEQNLEALYAMQLNHIASAPIQALFMVSLTFRVNYFQFYIFNLKS